MLPTARGARSRRRAGRRSDTRVITSQTPIMPNRSEHALHQVSTVTEYPAPTGLQPHSARGGTHDRQRGEGWRIRCRTMVRVRKYSHVDRLRGAVRYVGCVVDWLTTRFDQQRLPVKLGTALTPRCVEQV